MNAILKEIRQRLDYGSWATLTGMENDLEGLRQLVFDDSINRVRCDILIRDLSEAIDKRKAVITLNQGDHFRNGCIARFGKEVIDSWQPKLS